MPANLLSASSRPPLPGYRRLNTSVLRSEDFDLLGTSDGVVLALVGELDFFIADFSGLIGDGDVGLINPSGIPSAERFLPR